MHVAIDIDDVIADLMRSLVLFHNDRYGTKLTREDFHSCWYREVWGGTKEEEVKKLEEFFESHYFRDVFPTPGSQQAMNFLINEGHKLSVVTGRVYSLTQKTEEWIEKHFPNVFSEIYHTNSYGLTGKKLMTSEMCKIQNMDFILDDAMMHILDCSTSGIPVLVYDSPWNQGVLPNGTIRMKSWDEIPKLIQQL